MGSLVDRDRIRRQDDYGTHHLGATCKFGLAYRFTFTVMVHTNQSVARFPDPFDTPRAIGRMIDRNASCSHHLS